MRKRRVAAWLLSAVMLVTAFPQQAVAMGDGIPQEAVLETEEETESEQDFMTSSDQENVELEENVQEAAEQETNSESADAQESQETSSEKEEKRQSKETDLEAEGFTYRVNNDQVSITGWTGTEKDLVIPDVIEDKPVTEIASNAFVDANDLETVTLPAQEVFIRSGAFQNCGSLRQVKLQKNLKDMDKNAFVDCNALTTLFLGKDVSRLQRYSDGTTYGTALTEFLVEEGNPCLESIDGVLYRKENQEQQQEKALLCYPINRPGEEYRVEDGTKVLETYGIAGSLHLKKLSISPSVQDWDDSVAKMPVLEEVILEEGIQFPQFVYGDLFLDCQALKILDIRSGGDVCDSLGSIPKLEEVRIGKNVTDLDFENMGWLRNAAAYTIEEGNPAYQIVDGAVCDYEGKLLRYPLGSENTQYHVPDSITVIGGRAFSGNNSLVSLTMGDQVRTIEERAFYQCPGLAEVQLSRGLEEVQDEAFLECTALESLELTSQAEDFELGDWILDSCSSLKSVSFDIHGQVKLDCFSNAPLLETAAFGAGITDIVPSSTHSIQRFVIDEANPYIKSEEGAVLSKDGKRLISYAIGNPQEAYEIPRGVEVIEEDAFSGAKNLKDVTLPETLQSIEEGAFDGCENLQKILIPEGTRSIGRWAFSGCDDLALADIPRSVEEIGDNAFACVIWGYPDTQAQRYAQENGLLFLDKTDMEEDQPASGNLPESAWDGASTEAITPQGKTYVIENADQLAWVARETANGNQFFGCRFKLIADIDLGGHPWMPIGSSSRPFYGSFDGQNHTIRNLKTDDSLESGQGFGLFGYVRARASGQETYIRNVKIEDAKLNYGNDQGIVAGVIDCGIGANMVVENCHTAGEVNGGTMGGIVGTLYAGYTGSQVTIRSCSSGARIVTSGNGGGIAGVIRTRSGENSGNILVEECKFQGSTGATGRYGKPSGIASGIYTDGSAGEIRLSRCVNEADIQGSSYVSLGGLVCETGNEAPVRIEKCVNKGSVHNGYWTGGIAGGIAANTTISQCYNTGEIGYAYVGGGMGGICGNSSGTIVDCYNDGKILHTSAMDYNGGITGRNGGVIENCYNVGTVPESGNTSVDVSYPGAISCTNDNLIRHCYFNLDEIPEQWLIAKAYCGDEPREVYTSEDGKRVESGGLSTAAMKTSESYANWDFESVWEFDSEYAYGYPVLSGIKDLIDKHPDNGEHKNKRKTRELKVTVAGRLQPGEKKAPLLEDVTVELGSESEKTNQKGVAVLATSGEQTTLRVSKEGYVTYTRESFQIPKSKEYRVTLLREDEVTEYDLGSVIMNYNGNEYELLAEKKEINNLYKDTEFTIKASPAISGGEIGGYRLVQGEKNIAESTDGLFTVKSGQFEETKKKDGKERPAVKIEVLDKEGKVQSSTEIYLEVVYEEERETSFTFGDDLAITVDESVPFIGGTEMTLSDFDLPVYFVLEPEEDKIKCKLGINLLKEDLKDPEKTKTFLTCANMDFLDSESMMEDRNKFLEKMRESTTEKKINFMPKWSATFNIYGYAEGEFPSGGTLKGKLFAEVAVTGSTEGQIGPIVVAGDITGKVGANGEFVLDTVELNQWEGKLGIQGSVEMNIFGGIGAAYLASVGIYGDGKFGLDATALPMESSGFNSMYLQGSVGAMARLFGHSVKYSILDGTYYILNRDASTARSRSQARTLEDVLLDYDGYEAVERDSYDSEAVWNGSEDQGRQARVTAKEKTLLSNTYPETAPLVFTCGGDTVMVFVNDYGAGRSEADKSALYYSVYEDYNNWSEPKLVSDNGTADFNPKVASDGNNAWIVWNDASSSLEGLDSIEDIGARTEVAVARYDSATHSFQTQTTITSNDQYEIMPQISIASGSPAVSWTLNSEGNFWKTSGTNQVYLAQSQNGGWSSRQIAGIQGAVTGEALGTIGGELYYAYVTDGDGNLENTDGGQAHLLNIQTGATVSLEGEQAANVQFGRVGGEDQILWTDGDGSLHTRSAQGDDQVASFEDEGISGIVRQVISGEDGKAAILFTKNGENCANAYAAYYDPQTRTWSQISPLTEASEYVEQVQGAFVGDRLVLAYNRRRLDIQNDEDAGRNNLISKYIDQNQTELKVEDVFFWRQDVKAGQELPLTVSVKNQGDRTCTAVTVKITSSGQTVLEEDVDASIASGQTVEIPVNPTLPLEMAKADYAVQVCEKDYSGRIDSNLTQTVAIGGANFRTEANAYRNGDLYTVALAVFNDGYEAGGVRAVFYDEEYPDVALAVETVPNLEPDEVWNTSLDILPEDVGNRPFAKIGIRIESSQEEEEAQYDNGASAALYWDTQIIPESINLSDTYLEMAPGEAKQLEASVLPASADQTVVWSSSNPGVASVSETGRIQTGAEGSTVITASTPDGSVQASCRVIVKKKEPGHEHVWDQGQITREPTCAQKGVRTYTCTGCGATRTEEIPADPTKHSFVTKVDRQATCGAEGSRHRECAACGYREGPTVIPATGQHAYGSWVITKEATVLETGTRQRTCTVCGGAAQTETIAKKKATVELNVPLKKTLPLKVKQKVNIKVSALAKGDGVASWKSSNPKVAAVNQKGRITGKKTGTAKITVKLKSGLSAWFKVKVQKKSVATASLKLKNAATGKDAPKKISMKRKAKLRLTSVITPITSAQKVKYSSSNKKPVTVTARGVVSAKGKGKAVVTAKSGKKTVKIRITVK